MNAPPRTTAVVAVLGVAVIAGAVGPVAAAGTSPTYVQDDLTADATWTPEDGPYFVSTDVTIASGATLTIEAGTTVNIAEEVTVTVEGSLLATGSATDPVELTTAEPSPTAGTWETIEYAGGSESTLRLQHTLVEYGTTAVTATSSEGTIELADATVRDHVRTGVAVRDREGGPRVEITDSRFASLGNAGVAFAVPETNPFVESVEDLTVTGSTFESTGSYGVLVRSREISRVAVSDVDVSAVGRAGVLFATESTDARPTTASVHHATDVTLSGVRVTGAGTDGIRFEGGELEQVDVVDSTIRDVTGSGIRVLDATDADAVRFTGNTVTDSGTGVRVRLKKPEGGLERVSLTIADNTLAANDRHGVDADLAYVVVEDFAVRDNAVRGNGGDGVRLRTQEFANTAVIDNVVTGNDDRGVDAAANRVKGLEVAGNRITRNGDDGLAVRASDVLASLAVTHNSLLDNDGFGVDATGNTAGDARNEFRENTVVANVDGVRYAGPAGAHLANNSIALNTADRERPGDAPQGRTATGVVVEDSAGNVSLEHNDIYGHLTGLRSAANGSIDAENNYWGAESGPYHATLNPGGAGDSVETDSGKADPVPFASEPFATRFERPTAVLVANETTVEPGDDVLFSAEQSRDDGRLSSYYFSVDGDGVPGTGSASHVTSFAEPGTYEVTLTVEDDTGVRSLNDASVDVTVRVVEETTTATQTTSDRTTTPAPTTTPSAGQGDGESDDKSLVDSLLSVWGGIGAAFYLLALSLGSYGTFLSIRGKRPPFSGRTTHALAGAAVLTWAAAGVLVDGNLLTAAGGGAIAWSGLTGAVLALAS
jgi:hypothetical protein